MSYTAHWDMKDTKRGDTIKGFALTLSKLIGGDVIIPTSVCCQIRGKGDSLVYSYPVVIQPSGRLVFPRIEPEITREMSAGVYKYDVEFTLPDGEVRTYLSGSLRITEDVSRCLAP